MSRNKLFMLLGVLLLAALVLGACQPAAAPTSAPEPTEAMEEPTEAMEEPTEAMEEPTEAMEEPTEEMMEFEGKSVVAPNCDYGGKVLSIEAMDAYYRCIHTL